MSDMQDKASVGVREAAADWVVRWNAASVSADEETTFFDWLRRSPLHVKEYLRAEAAWLAMDGAVKDDASDVRALLTTRPDNLVALGAAAATGEKDRVGDGASTANESTAPQADNKSVAKRSLRRRFAIAAAVILAVSAGATPWLSDHLANRAYSTAVGELRRVVLEDGSAVELNTASKVHVRLTDAARDIYLDNGEAYFEVASDPKRPFRVFSDTTVVRAVGTQFNVYRGSAKTVVTVVEGQVAVSAGSRDSLYLPAGRTAVVTPQAMPTVQNTTADTREFTAWRQRRLVFRNESLSEVIAEFNRYNRQQLLVEDPRLAAERISAVFDADDSQALVRFLKQQGNVGTRELPGGGRLLVPPP